MATRRPAAQRFLLLLVVAAAALAAVLVWPFWAAFFLAAVLAATFRRWMEALARLFGGRRGLAALVLTLGVLVALVVPVASLGTLVVGQVLDGIGWVRQAFAAEGVGGLVARLPGPLEAAARRLLDALPNPQQQLQTLAGSQGGEAAKAVGGVLFATGSLLFQSAMMLIAFFFFLVDGRRLVGWIGAALPLEPRQFHALMDDFRRTSVAVLVSTAGTAAIQTVVGTVGYLVARAPNPIFLAVVTLVAALVPAVGGAVVVVIVGIVQLLTGHVVAGVFLVAWGVVVVSLVDNFARPYLLKGGMELNGGVVFFALLGGLAVFGGIGILLGPLITTFLVAAVRLYARDYGAPAETAQEDARAQALDARPPPPLHDDGERPPLS